METVATQHAEYNVDAMRGAAYKASSLLKAMGNADRLMLLCQLSQG
ncbi:MAG: transcriptional regulator, partial [Janthinobacterium sp.]